MTSSFYQVFLILLLTCSRLFAQPFLSPGFEHIGTQDGLAHRVVNDIMQDHKGYIWMATQNGLQRYDGQRFMTWHKNFDNPASLPSDNVSKVYEDHANNIWVVCHNGIGILNTANSRFRLVPLALDKTYSELLVYNFFEDEKNHIWLATKEAGLLCLDTIKNEFVKATAILPPHPWKFTNITEEPVTGNYWLSSDSGIAYADMKKKAIYNYNFNPDELPALENPFLYKNAVQSTFIDSYLKLWMTTSGSEFNQYRYNLFTKKYEDFIPARKDNFGYFQDHDGNVWMNGEEGLNVWKPAPNNVYTIATDKNSGKGFDAESVYKVCEDYEHNLWIATDNGVFVLNPLSQQINIKTYIDAAGKTADQNFTQFTELADGNIWAATWGAGLLMYDHRLKQVKHQSLAAQTRDVNYDLVWEFYNDKNSNIWIGCQLGRLAVYNITNGKFSFYRDTAFDQRTIRSIAEDKNSNIWFGTQHGLFVKWNPLTKRFTRYADSEYPERESLGNIHKIIFDNDNRMWAATQYGGLVEVDTETGNIKKAYTADGKTNHGMLSNVTYDLLQYNDSLLWVATTMGINIFNKKTQQVDYITTEDGLGSNIVLSMQKDNNGSVWVGTGDGFYKIVWPSKKIVRFGKRDGMENDGFQVSGMSKLKDGRILCATTKDFKWFYPDSLISGSRTPKVEITFLKVFNREINIDSLTSSNLLLELNYKENFISVEYAALSFLNRDRLTYYYKLEGQDNDWNKTNNYLLSNYSNLRPGLYTFQVYAETSEGQQGPETTFSFRILPPWWNSWWFYVLCAFLLAGIFYIWYRNRINKILDMEKVRNRIARDLHDDMGSTLSTINILSEMARRKVQVDTQKTSEYIDKISDNSQRMMEAMDDIVWSINPVNDSMQRILARMREYATNILEAKDINFQFRAEEALNDIKIGLESRRDLFLIFKEAVNNMAKYSQCNNAYIVIKLHKKNVVMLVSDDGIGFDINTADHGNGLVNMKQRATLLKGRLEIKSTPGNGTSVVMEVPV